ncbi:hypothetical protein [Rubinisphaera margarita]|uniref:hypothetical protein n=1 Tax=Rubinisphaera margarita TaxID=2909586 RepID=UPI001EE91B72|nr:hypothetical protein [Rubinisphaera margarita]MCG6155070.1 hypothetical protein [Rubinisphaera margarita]
MLISSRLSLLLLIAFTAGCAEKPQPATETVSVSAEPASPAPASGALESPEQEPVDREPAATPEPAPGLPVITFGGGEEAMQPGQSATASGSPAASEQQAETIISALKDLQILLGTWRGITQKNFDGSKSLDETNWVWDFKTDKARPALIMASGANPYYRQARMTYDPAQKQYQLQLTDPEGTTADFTGEFTAEIVDEPGDDDKPQRTYKLQFTETGDADKPRRFVLNQQNNNRYLLEVYEQRGSGDRFFRIDTVSTQREGTSMALIDEGYGERTCIISGGLGTMTVSYQGKTFYVCCTGCKAAFEEDPERWIARAEEAK